MISRAIAIAHWLWRVMELAVERIEVWFRGRPWHLAPSATPACLVAALLALVILGQRAKPRVAVAEPYRQAFRAALDAKDFQRAEVYLRKLTDLNAMDDRSRLRFAMLAQHVGKTDEAQEQLDAIRPRMQVGFPLPLDSALGTIAAESGQLVDARIHLERAWRQQPTNAGLLNNLAWVLANSQPPELERALELANAAVRQLPGNPEIRETRGQILVRLRQSQAAVADLESVLTRIRPQSLPAVHVALAEAYSQLGNHHRAQQHRFQSSSQTVLKSPASD